MTIHDSRLVRMTDEARRPTSWWLVWLVVMVLLVVVGPIGYRIGSLLLGDPASSSQWFPYVAGFGSLLVLAALYLWVRFKERRPFASLGFRPRRDGARLLLGFGIGGALTSIGILVGLLTGVYANGESTHTRSGAEALLPLLPLVLLYLVQGASQEAVTRGYLLPMSLRRLPVWVAIVGSCALVAVLHSLNPVSLLNAFLYAIFASFVALQQGSLWLVAGIQAGWSFFQLNVFGLPAGGIPDPSALWSVGPAPDSSSLLLGGSFGPDAGLLVTVVLAAATVVAYRRLRHTTRSLPHLVPAEATSEPALTERPRVTNSI